MNVQAKERKVAGRSGAGDGEIADAAEVRQRGGRANAPQAEACNNAQSAIRPKRLAKRAGARDKKPAISCQGRWRAVLFFRNRRRPRPGLLIGAGHSSFGGGAKRNGVEAIENNEFREMPHFAPLMISRAYACVAKSFASLREMNPSASPGSARRRRPKRGLRTRATALRASAARKGGRRSQMAPQVADIVQNGIETAPRLADAREPIRRTPLSC